eukprot:scaffold39113_cov153-Amphora_coffeaeformis.AAC.1
MSRFSDNQKKIGARVAFSWREKFPLVTDLSLAVRSGAAAEDFPFTKGRILVVVPCGKHSLVQSYGVMMLVLDGFSARWDMPTSADVYSPTTGIGQHQYTKSST